MTNRKSTKKTLTPGQRFGRWTVIGVAARTDLAGFAYWSCRCDCGTERAVTGVSLRSNNSRSCGCLNRELVNVSVTTHHQSNESVYETWRNMKQRCYNPKTLYYHRYGGRGIAVCERWRHSFENFYADMGPKPTPTHSIERRNRDGDYHPDNCCWATSKQQSRNTSRNWLVTFNGETHTVAEWAERLGISYQTLYQRFYKGWSTEKALTEPVRRR